MQNPEIKIFIFDKSIVKNLLNFKVIFSLCNTEEAQILFFPIFSMLFHVI